MFTYHRKYLCDVQEFVFSCKGRPLLSLVLLFFELSVSWHCYPYLFRENFCFKQLVESVLSKVVEEFEHRIASQYDLVTYIFIPEEF